MLVRDSPELLSYFMRAIELSSFRGIQVPRIVPAISAKQIATHSISSHYAAIKFGKSKSIVASLIALHNQRFYVFGALDRIEREVIVHPEKLYRFYLYIIFYGIIWN
jgi:hypothetical protein